MNKRLSMNKRYLSEIIPTETPEKFRLRRQNGEMFPILGEEGLDVFIQTKENPIVAIPKITIRNSGEVDLSPLKEELDALKGRYPEYFI